MSQLKMNGYLLQCITNLHVGSGDESYGVIDKLVQRDSADNLPVINGSSLKGALKEFFEAETGENSAMINFIFGGENGDQGNDAGAYSFTPAFLLALPVRSSAAPFFMATSRSCADNFDAIFNRFGFTRGNDWTKDVAAVNVSTGNAKFFASQPVTEAQAFLEEYTIKATSGGGFDNIKNLAGITGANRLAVVDDQDFQTLTDDLHLPVRARNNLGHLENGERVGRNLWYEQFVPRMSSFFFFVGVPDEKVNYFEAFEKTLLSKIVHVGANRSVGDGFCKISKLDVN